MAIILRWYDWFLAACGVVSGYMVALIAIAICAEVFSRNLGFGAIRGVLESVEYGLVLMTFAGTTAVFRAQRHIRVEILVVVLPPLGRLIVETVARLVVLAVVLGMTYATAKAALLAHGDGSTIRRFLTVPEWLPIALTLFGFALLCLEALRQLLTPREAGDEVSRVAAAAREGER